MFSKLRILTLSLLALSLMTIGCSKSSTQSAPQPPAFAITCVGVLPAAAAKNYDETVSATEAKQLQTGLYFLDELLKKHFVSRPDVRLVSDGQISGMDKNLPAQPLARARVIADRLSCNAVLETTLRRYKDRVGGQYTAKDPASVAFDYRLLAIPDGTVLCRGSFDVVQQSVMENLLNPKKAFTWLTAEELMRQGLEAKLNDCPYLVDDE